MKSLHFNELGERQIFAYCPRCRHEQPFVEHQVDHRSYLGLTLVTLGLGLISWIAACVGRRIYPWRCEHCGWQKSRAEAGGGMQELQALTQDNGFGVTTAMELKHRAERHRLESEPPVGGL